MGQQKEKALESGFTVNYRVVQTFICDFNKGVITVSFAWYKDQEHYESGGKKALEESIEVSIDSNSDLRDAIMLYSESLGDE